MKNSNEYYVLWFNGSSHEYLIDEADLRACAERYQFSAEDVLRFGEVEFDDDDGNGAYGGCYRAFEETEDNTLPDDHFLALID